MVIFRGFKGISGNFRGFNGIVFAHFRGFGLILVIFRFLGYFGHFRVFGGTLVIFEVSRVFCSF